MRTSQRDLYKDKIMWIRTKDKNHLIDANCFVITKNIGGKKEEKWAILAYSGSKFSDGSVICAGFPDRESARTALDKLINAVRSQENCSNAVYEF